MVLAVPVCLSMFLNFVFLCNIVRVLWMKLRAGPQVGGHASQPSRTLLQAFRATLLLLPLLGLQYLLTPFRPEKDHPWERVYEVTSAITASFQGLCVATLFCFFNGEVCNMIEFFKSPWSFGTCSPDGGLSRYGPALGCVRKHHPRGYSVFLSYESSNCKTAIAHPLVPFPNASLRGEMSFCTVLQVT